MPSTRSLLAATAALAMSLTIAACSGDSDSGSDGGSGDQIDVWTADTLPVRVAATEKIFADFTAKTGIKVKLTGVAEDQFTQVLTSSAAAGTLPDVWGSISLTQLRSRSGNDLAETEANSEVLEENKPDTW